MGIRILTGITTARLPWPEGRSSFESTLAHMMPKYSESLHLVKAASSKLSSDWSYGLQGKHWSASTCAAFCKRSLLHCQTWAGSVKACRLDMSNLPLIASDIAFQKQVHHLPQAKLLLTTTIGMQTVKPTTLPRPSVRDITQHFHGPFLKTTCWLQEDRPAKKVKVGKAKGLMDMLPAPKHSMPAPKRDNFVSKLTSA